MCYILKKKKKRFGDKEVTNDHTEISFNWESAVWKPQYSKSSTDKAVIKIKSLNLGISEWIGKTDIQTSSPSLASRETGSQEV